MILVRVREKQGGRFGLMLVEKPDGWIGRVGRIYRGRGDWVLQAVNDQPLPRRGVHDDALAESRTENDD